MSLKNRLLLLINDEGLNPNQFYVKTGLANGFLNTVGDKLRKPSIEKIEKAFPHWNMDYLLLGKGEAFLKGNISIQGDNNISNSGITGGDVIISSDQEIKILKEKIKNLERQVKDRDQIISTQRQTIQTLNDAFQILKKGL